MTSKNNILETIQLKTYSYKKGGMTFEWKVDINKRTDLRDSLEILQRAVEDIKADLHRDKK